MAVPVGGNPGRPGLSIFPTYSQIGGNTMSRWLAVWGATALAVAMTAGSALAIGPGGGPGGGGGGTGGGGGNPIPEINPGSAAAALTLLVGATLIVLDRRRRTKSIPETA
jgi:hypothetical protein